MYPHGDNLRRKSDNNYKKLRPHLEQWLAEPYMQWRRNSEKVDWIRPHAAVSKLVHLFEQYLSSLRKEIQKGSFKTVTTQSFLESSVMEEFCYYLFGHLPKEFQGLPGADALVYCNSDIFIGLALKPDGSVVIQRKNSDFCIARQSEVDIEGRVHRLRVPIVTVECKTSYVDKTMLSGLLYSARLAKQGVVGVRTYVLAETKSFEMSLHDSPIDEIFVLKKKREDAIDRDVVYDFYQEVRESVRSGLLVSNPAIPGRVIRPGFSLAKNDPREQDGRTVLHATPGVPEKNVDNHPTRSHHSRRRRKPGRGG